MFWMNGSFRAVDTLELFTFVRGLPEPLPIDMVVWDSPTSQLAGSGSEWSVILKGNLLALLAAIYEHHEAILLTDFDNDFSVPVHHRIRHLRDCCSKICQLIGFTQVAPLSVWTTEVEGVEESIAHYALALEPVIQQVMELPHIRKLLKNAEIRMRDFERLSRRHEADFNRTVKKLRRIKS